MGNFLPIYLPIAQISVDLLLIVTIGAAVGFLSGLFGVGGGFLITPLLIFLGIPTTVAVATGSNQVVASSVSGALAQWRRGNVDFKLGTVMLLGGFLGSTVGVFVVAWLKRKGQVDLFISLTYVLMLGVIGSLMLVESLNAIRKSRDGAVAASKRKGHSWLDKLPFKQRFQRSKLYVSAIPPLAIGVFVGFLSAIMGVGGGFVVVPALIYLMRVPTNVVIGTSLFQTIFVAGYTTVMQAWQNQTVDAVLAVLLVVGGVIGAQFGVRVGQNLRGEQLRALLAALVLAVAIRLAFGLILPPGELYSLSPLGS
jgi:uncharacterized membrane protein YfcA